MQSQPTVYALDPTLPPPPLPRRRPPTLVAAARNPRITSENRRIGGGVVAPPQEINPGHRFFIPGIDGDGPRPPAPQAAAPSGGPAPASPANYRNVGVENAKPRYPLAARMRAIEGDVLLRVRVSSDGRADNVSVIESSGHRMLDDAAVEAVRSWRFRPGSRNGRPAETEIDVPVSFRLNG